MRLRVGTSGYDFDDWVGAFYAEDTPRSARLAAYAAEFDTVEINNTFYRNPKSSVVAGWADQVPADFAFSIKASKRITQRAPLTDLETLGYLWRAVSHLGARLGPVLFQMSPYFTRDDARLRDFLARLPEGLRGAFEFRHGSWAADGVHAMLREFGHAWCVSDQPKRRVREVVATAEWGYVRLHAPAYSDAEVAEWAARLRDTGWDEAFVYFKHDLDTAGPVLARRLRDA